MTKLQTVYILAIEANGFELLAQMMENKEITYRDALHHLRMCKVESTQEELPRHVYDETVNYVAKFYASFFTRFQQPTNLHMEHNMYLVIQKGYALFGRGATAEQAVADMKQWIDSDSEMQNWTVDDFNTSYDSANDGEFVLVPATDELLSTYR